MTALSGSTLLVRERSGFGGDCALIPRFAAVLSKSIFPAPLICIHTANRHRWMRYEGVAAFEMATVATKPFKHVMHRVIVVGDALPSQIPTNDPIDSCCDCARVE